LAKYIDPTRSPLWPHWLTPLVRPLERVLLIDRLNACLTELGGDAALFLREMTAIGGKYVADGEGLASAVTRPSVVFANHPLGGADVIAALGMMESLGTPYGILATNVILAPEALKASVIAIDNSETRSGTNAGQVRQLVSSLKQRRRNLFVFPAGHCSVFSLRRGVADIAWKDTFVRLAAMSDAGLVPVWFSGRNSVFFYLVGYLIGRLRSLLLPLEFFGGGHGRLIYRVGRPIESCRLPLFGDAVVEAMRASVYLLGAMASARRRDGGCKAADHAARQMVDADEISVACLEAGQVRRDKLAALRRRCGEDDAWTPLDEVATHLAAVRGDDYVGACRLVRGADVERTGAASMLSLAYVRRGDVTEGAGALEFDGLLVDPSLTSSAVADRLLTGLRQAIGGRGESVCAGVLALDDCDPVLAEAQFEFARRQSPCALTARLRPRAPLVPPSPLHAFSADQIRYSEPPRADALSDILRVALARGLRFGPSARGGALGERSLVAATITSQAGA
jgi:hypothetical protein